MIAASALIISACGSDEPADPTKLDASSSLACQDLRTAINDSSYLIKTNRAKIAADFGDRAGSTATTRVRDAAPVLARSTSGNAKVWQLGMDTAAAACLDSGFGK